MQEYKRYIVHDKKTGEFLAEGTVSQCAKALRLSVKGFQSAILRAETVGHGKYEIIDENPERKRSWTDSKSVNKALYEQAQKWDKFITPIRERFGIQVNTASDNAEHCICCGEQIPEGRQVCPNCEHKEQEGNYAT